MRVAALDLGSNTFLLLVVDVDGDKITKILRDEARVTRLGQGVNESKNFHPEALRRADQCFKEYREIIDSLNVDKVLPVATSAARDVKNRDEFFSIAEKYDFHISVIPGWKEAEVSFLGTTYDLDSQEGVAIIDVGGGSTEIIGKNTDGKVEGCSIDVGSVRLTEKFITGHPVCEEELASMQEYIINEVEAVKDKLPFKKINRVIAVAGTPTTLAAVHQAIEFEADKIHGFKLNLEEIKDWIFKFSDMSVEEREQLVGMQKKRADVIVAGASILLVAAQLLKAKEITVSTKGVRFGVALEGERLREAAL